MPLPPRLQELYDNDQQEFFKQVRKLSAKTIIPHESQRPVIESNARFKVMNCGRRFGKTVIAAKLAIAKTRERNQMIWWVAPTYKIVKRGYEQILKQLPEGVLAKEAPPDTNFDAGRSVILHFKNGTKMEFYSAERPEGMLGAAVDFCVMDEAAIMPARIWNQIVSPTLIDHEGSALMISTPRGHNWFYRVWLKGQDKQEPLWESWTFTTQDNPTLPEGEADRMAADIPRMEADQEIFAKWVAAGSSVFVIPDKSVQMDRVLDNFLIEGVPPVGHVVLGIDLARTKDYTVLYGARSRDRRNCYFERMQAITWPEQKRRIRRAVATLVRAGATGVMLMIDSTGVGDPVKEDLEADGYDVVGLNFTTHKTNMVRLLAKDIEESRAFILDEGYHEFRNYAMAQTPSGKMNYSAPDGEHDDIVSAKMLQHWGFVNEGVPEVQVLGAHGEDDQFEDSDPWETEEYETYDDLLDDGGDLTDEEADHAIGVDSTQGPRVIRVVRDQPSPEDVFKSHAEAAQNNPHSADFLLG